MVLNMQLKVKDLKIGDEVILTRTLNDFWKKDDNLIVIDQKFIGYFTFRNLRNNVEGNLPYDFISITLINNKNYSHMPIWF